MMVALRQSAPHQKNHFGIQLIPRMGHYRELLSGNDLLTVPATLEIVIKRTVDVKTRKLVGVIMEVALKSISFWPKGATLCGSSRLTAIEKLAGSIIIRSLRMQAEYMSTQKKK